MNWKIFAASMLIMIAGTVSNASASEAIRCEKAFLSQRDPLDAADILKDLSLNEKSLRKLASKLETKARSALKEDRGLIRKDIESILNNYRELKNKEIFSFSNILSFSATRDAKSELLKSEFEIRRIAERLAEYSDSRLTVDSLTRRQEKLYQWSGFYVLNSLRVWANELTFGIRSDRFSLPPNEVNEFIHLAERTNLENALLVFSKSPTGEVKKQIFVRSVRRFLAISIGVLTIYSTALDLNHDAQMIQSPDAEYVAREEAQSANQIGMVSAIMTTTIQKYDALISNPKISNEKRAELMDIRQQLIQQKADLSSNQ